MKNKNKTLAPIAPAITFKLERPIESIRQMFVYDGNGNVSFAKGANPKPEEIAALVNEDQKTGEAMTVRAANTFRLSRKMDDVEIDDGNGGKQKVAAISVTMQALKSMAKSDASYYSILGLAEAIDVHEANNLIPDIAYQTVKEAIGTFRKLGALPKAGSGELMKLKAPSDEPRAAKLVNLFKKATPADAPKANSVRGFIGELMGKKAPVKKAAKETPAAKAKREAEEAKAEKEKWSVANLKAAVVALSGQWAKTVEHNSVQAVREGASNEVATLAKLAGFTIGNYSPK